MKIIAQLKVGINEKLSGRRLCAHFAHRHGINKKCKFMITNIKDNNYNCILFNNNLETGINLNTGEIHVFCCKSCLKHVI